MSTTSELANRIATFGHDDWQPAFGREIYTDVFYLDVPDALGGAPARYYIASLEEAEVLDDTELQARIEAVLGLVVPGNDAVPPIEVGEDASTGMDAGNAPPDQHQTDPALPTVSVTPEEAEAPMPQEDASIETVQGASDGG